MATSRDHDRCLPLLALMWSLRFIERGAAHRPKRVSCQNIDKFRLANRRAREEREPLEAASAFAIAHQILVKGGLYV